MVNTTKPFAPEPANMMAEFPPKSTTFMDRWMEPNLAPARPSYAEAGFERGGTVANMAPLGTLPSQKVLKSVSKAEGRDCAGRVKRSEASNATTPTSETPDLPLSFATRRQSQSPRPLEEVNSPPRTPAAQKSPQLVEGEEMVKQPDLEKETLPSSETPAPPESPLPGPPTRRTTRSMSVQTPAPYDRTAPPTPEYDEDGLAYTDPDFTDKVIQDAVDKALEYRRLPTAYALRTLHDERSNDNVYLRLVESVYYQRASQKEMGEFNKMLTERKRVGRKNREAEYYFNGDGSDPDPPLARPVLKAVCAALTYDTPNLNVRPGSALNEARGSSFSSASPREFDFSHLFKKQKVNHYISPFGPPPLPTTYISPFSSAPSTNGNSSAAPKKPDTPHLNGDSVSAPATRARRSDSISSSSSLSSVDEDVIQSDLVDLTPASPDQAKSPVKRRLGRAPRESTGDTPSAQGAKQQTKIRFVSGHAKSANAAPPLPTQNDNSSESLSRHSTRSSTPAETPSQPIAIVPPTKHKTGPRTYTFSTTTSTSSSIPTQPLSGAQPSASTRSATNNKNSDMAPVRLLPESASVSVSSRSDASPLITLKTKFQGKGKKLNPPEDDIEEREKNEETNKLKRKARATTNQGGSAPESFVRGSHNRPPLIDVDTASEGGEYVSFKLQSRQENKRKRSSVIPNTRETRQRLNHDDSQHSSPTHLGFQQDLPPGSVPGSRAGTPAAGGRPTRKAKTGSGLRVKTSPVKKKGGIVAGIPRASGERSSPSGHGGPPENKDDNDDYCAACGGNGDLVCCDGCNRSFHFKCVDPPMIEGALPDAWYCNSCNCKFNPQPIEERTNPAFGLLLQNLQSKNPSAFHLPKSIREYFEGVQTGAEGEYEEPAPPKPKNRGGYDEAPDYFRTKDSKGKLILCHQCNGSASAPNRMIIPCNYCGLYWHLDCLDVPMAKEPPVGRQWRCPAHIDDLMSVLPAKLGKAHRWRRIKGSSTITPSIPRGTRNNGHVEIENTPDDEEDEPKGFYEETQFGTVYKLPEEGLKLDFISKVKARGGGISRSGVLNGQMAARPAPVQAARSLVEQQAALNLLALSIPESDRTVGGLISTLLDEAPPAVFEMLAKVDTSAAQASKKLSSKEREKLRPLQSWLNNYMAAGNVEQDEDEDKEVPALTDSAVSQNTDELDEDTAMTL